MLTIIFLLISLGLFCIVFRMIFDKLKLNLAIRIIVSIIVAYLIAVLFFGFIHTLFRVEMLGLEILFYEPFTWIVRFPSFIVTYLQYEFLRF